MTDKFTLPLESLPFHQTADVLWEPVWNLRVSLTPCERDLLDTWPLRRLGYVRTFGAGGLQMPTQHSRLSHVIGVFALVAHFCYEDEELRLAALLHDVGHGPFSHSSEILPGFDHHLSGNEIVSGSVVGDILRKYGFEPARIIALTEGEPPNPVRTQNGLLHLDHLDFFVRDPFACGWHSPLPVDLLSRLHLEGANVAAEMAVAEHLVERILFEHRLFTAPVKIAAEAVLKRLLLLGAQLGILKTDSRSVVAMTDADLLAHLGRADDPQITSLLDRLLSQPQTLLVHRVEPNGTFPASALTVRFDQPYLGQPLVDGQPVSQRSARAASMLAEARALLGTYLVEISD